MRPTKFKMMMSHPSTYLSAVGLAWVAAGHATGVARGSFGGGQ
eukprot:SAG31_NODE_2749_length_5147_cov_1.972662_1_plen_42_part_10